MHDPRHRRTTTPDIDLVATAAELQARLDNKKISAEEQTAVQAFIDVLEKNDERVFSIIESSEEEPLDNTPAQSKLVMPRAPSSDPYLAFAVTVPSGNDTPTVPRTERIAGRSLSTTGCSAREQPHYWPGILIGAILGLVFVASVVMVARKNRTAHASISPGHTLRLAKPAQLETPTNSRVIAPLPDPPATALAPTLAVSTPSLAPVKLEPAQILLYRYKVNDQDVRKGENTIHAIATQFGCNAVQLRDYNRSLFKNETDGHLTKGQLVWIPTDECAYRAETRRHYDATMSYRVASGEAPLRVADLGKRFGCRIESLRRYLLKESPHINPDMIPAGSRVFLPSTYCTAINR